MNHDQINQKRANDRLARTNDHLAHIKSHLAHTKCRLDRAKSRLALQRQPRSPRRGTTERRKARQRLQWSAETMTEFFGANVLEHPDGWKCGVECAFAAVLFEALATATLDSERLKALAEMVRLQRDARASSAQPEKPRKPKGLQGDSNDLRKGLPEGVRRAIRAVYGLDMDENAGPVVREAPQVVPAPTPT